MLPKTLAILAKYGTDATFKVKTGGGVPDPSTSTVSAVTTTDVLWKISPPAPYSAFLIDDDVIQAGDMKTVLAAQGITFTPAVAHPVTPPAVPTATSLTFGGYLWRIMAADPIYSGDLVCAYQLQLRRGIAA